MDTKHMRHGQKTTVKLKLYTALSIPWEEELGLAFSWNDLPFTSLYHFQKKHSYLNESWLGHHQKNL